jgi:hypothetical protein
MIFLLNSEKTTLRNKEPKLQKVISEATFYNEIEFQNENDIDQAALTENKLLIQSILVYERLFGKNRYATVHYIDEM